MQTLLIVGCGYTGRRVAARWLQTGGSVIATSRSPETLANLEVAGARVLGMDIDSLDEIVQFVPDGCAVLHSVPIVESDNGPLDPTPQILRSLAGRMARIVYLSTTGVYGSARLVDHTTPASATTPRLRLRIDAERAIAGAGCSWMVLRPAAIYGPWRGIHAAMREGRFQLAGDGSNYISRIHVEDLARHTVAALLSTAGGCYPVADEEHCPSATVAAYCAELLGIPMPKSVSTEELSETRRSNRRVDASETRRLLNLRLCYPTFREGIRAALDEEERAVRRPYATEASR